MKKARRQKAKQVWHLWRTHLKVKPEYPVRKRRTASAQRALNTQFHFLTPLKRGT